jgi:hypothetical protein
VASTSQGAASFLFLHLSSSFVQSIKSVALLGCPINIWAKEGTLDVVPLLASFSLCASFVYLYQESASHLRHLPFAIVKKTRSIILKLRVKQRMHAENITTHADRF